MRGPGFIQRIAEFFQRAVHTSRLSGHTNLPAMMNNLVRKIDPPILRNDPHQVPFHLLRGGLLRQFQSSRNTQNMCINNNSRRNLKPGPEHNIPRLPSYSRQPKNLLHRLRNLASKLLDHNLRRALNRLRLISKESSSPNQLLQLRQRSRSHSLWSRKRLEQRWSHKIHPNISTLRRQNRRHRKLPRTPVMQRANYPRIRLPQNIQNRRNAIRSQRITRLPSFFLRRDRLRSCNQPSLHS
jgi:hypothetical protein